uniref:Uncharacterized protein n=1 Tax=Anguilla anguilla TaxID=7936 RepID=A0A0E9PE78_ANGAN
MLDEGTGAPGTSCDTVVWWEIKSDMKKRPEGCESLPSDFL